MQQRDAKLTTPCYCPTANLANATGYLGCYAFPDPNAFAPDYARWWNSYGQTRDSCRTRAAQNGLPLFAMFGGIHCFGGANLTVALSYGRSAGCDKPCPGNANFTCGGDGHFSLFKTVGGERGGALAHRIGCRQGTNCPNNIGMTAAEQPAAQESAVWGMRVLHPLLQRRPSI